jgi:uncharacterized phage infection (PIP) family protein YhgE
VRRAIVLLALALVVAAGCGGDGDDSTEVVTATDDTTEVVTATAPTETTEPLTKAEYIEQADAICGDFNSQLESLNEEVQRQLTDRDFEAAADTLSEAVEVSRSGIEQLEALPKPAGDETVLDQLDDARQQIIALLASNEDAIREEAFVRIRSLLRELQAADQRADGIATGYGFKVCGQGD